MGRIQRRVGDVLKVPHGNGMHSYAHVSTEPTVVFYDYQCADDKELPLEKIGELPVAFRIWVFNKDVRSGDWPRVGRLPLNENLLAKPYMFKQDNITGRLSIYHDDYADSNYERPANLSECKGLEKAAVWNACHVRERLVDHFANRENKWVKSLGIDEARVPEEQKK